MGMSATKQLDDVSVVCKANVYFDGKVVSHTILLKDGKKKSLGLIFPGSHHFSTNAPELMEIVAGSSKVRQAGSNEWTVYPAGTSLRVPGNSAFDIAVESGIAEYICSYE